MDSIDKNRNPFNVPEGYFDEIAEKLGNYASAESASREVPIRVMLKPLAALAAVIAGVAIITFIIVQTVPRQQLRGEMAPPDVEEILRYLGDETDRYTLESLLAESSDLLFEDEESDSDSIIEFLMLSQISIDEIMAFIDDQWVD